MFNSLLRAHAFCPKYFWSTEIIETLIFMYAECTAVYMYIKKAFLISNWYKYFLFSNNQILVSCVLFLFYIYF